MVRSLAWKVQNQKAPADAEAFFLSAVCIKGAFWRSVNGVTHCALVEMPSNGRKRWAGKIELLPHYMTTADAPAVAIPASVTVGCGRSERNHPAESHARGITNSDQPQSRQTRMSGEGVIGG